MSKRTLWYIIMGAVLLHAGLFLYLGRFRALPKADYRPPQENFGYREVVRTDMKTGERTVTQEYTVSTRLVTPEELAAMQRHARPRSTPQP